MHFFSSVVKFMSAQMPVFCTVLYIKKMCARFPADGNAARTGEGSSYQLNRHRAT